MNTKPFRPAALSGLLLCSAVLAALIGCTKVETTSETAAASPAPAAAPATVDAPDDYVYYPNYEVYYSSRRHDYRYRDGNAWVTRPAPSHVSVDVLLASPSVRMDFHDAPERHHEAIVRSYPHNWAPAGSHNDKKDEHKGDGKDDEKRHN